MAVLNQYVSIAEESAYGTIVSPTRGIIANSEGWDVELEQFYSEGFRQNRQAALEDHYRANVLGATGSFEVPLLTRGMGLLLKNSLGDSTKAGVTFSQSVGTGNGSNLIFSGTIAGGGVVDVTAIKVAGTAVASLSTSKTGNNIVITGTGLHGTTSNTVNVDTGAVSIRFAAGSAPATGAAVTLEYTLGVHDQTFTSNAAGPDKSYSIQIGRVDVDNVARPATYAGSMITTWSLSAGINEAPTMSFDFDAESESLTQAAATVVYPDAEVYNWADLECSIGGNTVTGLRQVSLDADLGMKTDRYYLRGSTRKAKPTRHTLPNYGGSLEFDLDAQSVGFRADALAGTTRRLDIAFTHPTNVAGSVKYHFKFECRTVKFGQGTPAMNPDGTTTLSLPYMVVWDEENPAVKIEVRGADSDY